MDDHQVIVRNLEKIGLLKVHNENEEEWTLEMTPDGFHALAVLASICPEEGWPSIQSIYARVKNDMAERPS